MMPNVTTSAMQKSVSACLVIALFCLFLSTAPWAQTDTQAEDVATSLAICKDVEADVEGDENEYRPCEQYIDANTEDSADTIKWIIEEIDERKEHAREVTSTFYVRDEIVHWILVILSLLTTISAAITKVYPKLNIKGIDFAIVPIVLSAMIAAVTSINAYYQFDEYGRLSQNLTDDLIELEADIHFGLLRHVAGRRGESAEVDEETINEWHERLKAIMERYSARETGNGV
jgi:hypothetical protein